MKTRLISLDGHLPQCDGYLNNLPMVIGHDVNAELPLDDASVADRHCRIGVKEGHLVVQDLGSVHGTFVNGCRISEAELAGGDELSIGMLTFLVECRDEPQESVGGHFLAVPQPAATLLSV